MKNDLPKGFMVFDVESIGLHGDAFAVAWVMATADGTVIGEGAAHVPAGSVDGPEGSRKWVEDNVTLPSISLSCDTPRQMRDAFWDDWCRAKRLGFVLCAECCWPVETNFLSRCIADDMAREWHGPYPMYDIAMIRFAAGFDPLATEDRLPAELPCHQPLADSRQSLRLMLEAMQTALFADASH